jgi:hypothetical protein
MRILSVGPPSGLAPFLMAKLSHTAAGETLELFPCEITDERARPR